MRQVPEPEHSEWVRRMRELARQDAEELVPRPRFAVLGLSAPVLSPAALASFEQVNGTLESVSLAYGDWSAPAGPYITVTSTLMQAEDAAATAHLPGHGAEAELLRAIDTERNRIADHAGVDDQEPDEPPQYTLAQLPSGEALICRHGTLWAARPLDTPVAPAVAVTITGRGVEPRSVRISPADDLRPFFEARNEILGQLTARRRLQPPPVLEPAEGVAAFRALADFTLGFHERLRRSVRDRRTLRHRAGEPQMRHALWQRAVSEQRRITGVDERAADDVVTLVINHLSHLAEQAPWFADTRLRDLAIDETLRHAMLGDDVPSKPAQQAWARYWAVRYEHWRRSRSPEPGDVLADLQAGKPIEAAWLSAWAAWAARA